MRLLVALLVLFSIGAAHAQTGSVKSQAQLNTEIGTTGCTIATCLYPDNTGGQITAFGVRQGLLDMTATMFGAFTPLQTNAASLWGNPTGSAASASQITLGTGLTFVGSSLGCLAASATQVGCVEPDNVTIVVSAGKLTAVGASASSVDAGGATTISNGVSGDCLYDNAGAIGNLSCPGLALNNKYTGGNYFRNGQPWCDVIAEGAVGDGSTDDSTAINACQSIITALGGGTIYFPPTTANTYCHFTGLTTTTGTVLYAPNPNTIISPCNHDVTTVVLTGESSRITNLGVSGCGANTTDTCTPNHVALRVSDCGHCIIEPSNVLAGLYGIKMQGGCDCTFHDINVSSAYGPANFWILADASPGISSGWLRRVKVDDVFPTGAAPTGYSGSGTISAWSTCAGAGCTWSLNQLATNDGYYWQVTQAGTGATSGGGPQATKYNVTVVDGTAHWQMVSAFPSYNIQCDSGCYQWSFDMVDMTGPHTYNLYEVNSQGSSGTTNATTSTSSQTLNFASAPTVIAGWTVLDLTTPGAINPGTIVVASAAGCTTGATTICMNQDAIGPGVGNGDVIQFVWSSPAGLLQMTNSTAGQGFSQVLNLASGSQNKFINNTFDSCFVTGCVDVYPNSKYGNELTLVGNTIYGGSYGLDWAAGNNLIVNGNTFSGFNTAAILGQTSGLAHGVFNGNVSTSTEGQNAKFWDITGGPSFITACGNDASNISGSNTLSASNLVPATYSACNN